MLRAAFSPQSIGIVLTLAAVAGCGEGREAASVSGAIRVNGQPLADILVTFQPVGGGVGSTGTTDDQGRYTLQFVDTRQAGAIIGKHQVTFQDLRDKPAIDSDAGSAPPSKSRLPRGAQGELREFDVPAAGTDAADFELR